MMKEEDRKRKARRLKREEDAKGKKEGNEKGT